MPTAAAARGGEQCTDFGGSIRLHRLGLQRVHGDVSWTIGNRLVCRPCVPRAESALDDVAHIWIIPQTSSVISEDEPCRRGWRKAGGPGVALIWCRSFVLGLRTRFTTRAASVVVTPGCDRRRYEFVETASGPIPPGVRMGEPPAMRFPFRRPRSVAHVPVSAGGQACGEVLVSKII